ncbi:MAG: hypothetical protein H6719_30530 [Sandaracinaceae bacterium]|nr:hypothetical protein [Sandaracinaceae bacterium]
MRRVAIALALLVPATASANDVYPTACDGADDPVTAFAITESVCVSGLADLECDGAAGADVYVVPHGADPFAGSAVHVTATFDGVLALMGPLPPAVYDLFLDEQCDGMQTAEDLLVENAFEVGADLACEAPGPPIDPGLGNHATCRGACGSGCPDTCTPGTPTTVCVEDAGTCRHQSCTFETLTCITHDGCRVHDDCYDACVASGGGFWCHRQCDLGCVGRYGLSCGGWATGRGPSDGEMTYYGNVVTTGATSGLCSGGC